MISDSSTIGIANENIPTVSQATETVSYSYNRKFVTILGYFPLVGVIVGVTRIIFAAKSELTASERGKEILRGMAECICLGPFLAIFDAIVMLHERRKRSVSHSASVSSPIDPEAVRNCEMIANLGEYAQAVSQLLKGLSSNKYQKIFIFQPQANKSDLIFEGPNGCGDGQINVKQINFTDYPKGAFLLIILAAENEIYNRYNGGWLDALKGTQPIIRQYLEQHDVIVLNPTECEQALVDKMPSQLKKIMK